MSVPTNKTGDEHVWLSQYTSHAPDLYFSDGKRRIDFVLVYTPATDTEEKRTRRKEFLTGLELNAIEYEIEDCFGEILGQYHVDAPTELPTVVSSVSQGQVYAKLDSDEPTTSKPTTSADKPAITPDKLAPSAMDRYRLQADPDAKKFLDVDDLVFIKLYAPWDTMCNYAELFKFRKPIKIADRTALMKPPKKKISECCQPKHPGYKKLQPTFTGLFNKKRQYLFDIPVNKDEFFTAVERSSALDYTLRMNECIPDNYLELLEEELAEMGPDVTDDELHKRKNVNIGITKVISDGVFTAAYPLHEFDQRVQNYYDNYVTSEKTGLTPNVDEDSDDIRRLGEPIEEDERADGKEMNNRILLEKYWATYSKITHSQPLDYIRYYFGEATAFYFAWLGFYTKCLVPVAILGVLIFLFGLLGMVTDPITVEVCKDGANVLMCPQCAQMHCKYWTLKSSCLRTKLTQLVDNEGTVVFAIIMSLWSVMFLELWKRRQSSLAFRWNVLQLEPMNQPPRPEFLALLDKGYQSKLNPVSNIEEPIIPFWSNKLPCTIFSFTTVLFGVVLTLAALVGIIFYKIVMKIVFYQQPYPIIQSTAGILTTITGSVINLIIIFIMKFIYDRIATKMTDMEKFRTQVEYDNSLTLKLYLLQFVNHYASIFYIAFIQGTTAALPGSKHAIIQSTGCDQGDCLFELFLQLIIIMVGKQVLSLIQESVMPHVMRLFMDIKRRCRQRKRASIDDEEAIVDDQKRMPVTDHLLACRADYNLLNPGTRPLFDESLEIMLQFGFITMFVPAFPLAPLFGLLNNILEIRGDAKKFITQYRRPVLERVKTIGIWYPIQLVISSLAIRTNACLIAFTTEFIDRWVYRYHYSPDMSTAGFKNFTLSYMSTSRFPVNTTEQYCRYIDYRHHPLEDASMSYTQSYYHVLAVKFIFLFLFEMISVFFTSLLAAIIPDVPQRLVTQMYYEASETSRVITEMEKRTKTGATVRTAGGGTGDDADYDDQPSASDQHRDDVLAGLSKLGDEENPFVPSGMHR